MKHKKATLKNKTEKSPVKPRGRSKYALKKSQQKKGKRSPNSPIQFERETKT